MNSSFKFVFMLVAVEENSGKMLVLNIINWKHEVKMKIYKEEAKLKLDLESLSTSASCKNR